ncbi:MAG: hypothetical protein QG653_286 [Patescibacteria group bacterium]|nr:hypothetical protein [Patescibacteria group bacterium]
MESIPSNEQIRISIETAQPNDAEEIQNVFYKTWLATYPNNVPGVSVDDVHEHHKEKLSEEGIEKSRKRIEDGLSLENQRFLVAKVDGKIAGVCLATVLEDKNQLNAIYVLPEFQGKGLGYKLWGEVLKFIDQTKDTVVQVVIYNTSAIEFYKRLGFEDTGKRWTDEKFKMKSGATFPEMEMKIAGSNNSKSNS